MGSKRRADEGIGPYRVRRRNRRSGRTKSSAPTIAWPMPCSSLYPLRKKETRQKPCQRVTRLARAAQRPDTHAGTERPHRGLSSADADALFEPLPTMQKRDTAKAVSLLWSG